MRVLALDTSTTACSVAIGTMDRSVRNILAHRFEVMARGQSEALAPMVQSVLDEAGFGVSDMDFVAVTTGPGAFTGVRIGLSMARALGLSAEIPVIGVSTLHAVAHGIPEINRAQACTLVIMDTKRDDVYVQVFSPSLSPITDPDIIAAEEISALIGTQKGQPDMILAGDAVCRVVPFLSDNDANVRVYAETVLPDAAVVADMALSITPPSADTPLPSPIYLRPPYAKISPTGGRLRP